MLCIEKDESFAGVDMPFGVLAVDYPPRDAWDLDGFERLKASELAQVRAEGADYDRRRDFGEEPYFRYFRRFKKTYTVMAQLESYLLKGRPFPAWSPVNQVAFLTELRTRMLTATHDADKIRGPVLLYRAAEETPFDGMGGRESHSYIGDLTGRDDEGIIMSMIAGPDARTCLTEDTRHAVYFVIAPPDMDRRRVEGCLDLMRRYVAALAPGAVTEQLLL